MNGQQRCGEPAAGAAGPTSPLLQVFDLRVCFAHERRRASAGGHRDAAVEDATFHIDRGETLALVGGSGAGKTTLGRAVLQLVRPTAGRVIFNGRELTALWRDDLVGVRWRRELYELRRRMQVVFQDVGQSFDPRLRIGDSIGEPLACLGLGSAAERRARVHDLCAEVGLSTALLVRRPHELSVGQLQRAAIARALAPAPELVVLDEPVSALDPTLRARVLRLLRGLQRTYGLSYLFIAHDLAAVRAVSHRVAVMLEGRIVEAGPTVDLLRTPRHPYTQALTAAADLTSRREPSAARQLPRGHEGPGRSPLGCPFADRCPAIVLPRCRDERPPLAEAPGARRIACWRELAAPQANPDGRSLAGMLGKSKGAPR